MYAFAYNLYEPPVDGVNGDAALHANHIADRNCPSRSNDGADCLLHSGNVRIFDQRLKSATRRSATTKDQKWPYFSKVSTTCLTRWNGRRNYEDSHSIWSQILFNLAVIINFIVAFFYPFDTDGPAPDPGTHLSGLCLVHVN